MYSILKIQQNIYKKPKTHRYVEWAERFFDRLKPKYSLYVVNPSPTLTFHYCWSAELPVLTVDVQFTVHVDFTALLVLFGNIVIFDVLSFEVHVVS